jgi:hypothetical protein
MARISTASCSWLIAALACMGLSTTQLLAQEPQAPLAAQVADDYDTGYCCVGGAPKCEWFADAGVYYIRPVWRHNPAFATAETVGTVTTVAQTDFDYDYSFAPVVRGGYRSDCGFGVQGRAWWYDDDQSFNLINPGTVAIDSAAPLGLQNLSTTAGDALEYASSLEIQSFDLMLTYPVHANCVCFDVGFGARYVRIVQEYNHIEDPLADDLIDAVFSEHDFDGIGPSVSLEGRWDLCPLALFVNTRYSLLYGQSKFDAFQVVNSVPAAAVTQENDDLRPIVELEIGGEYTHHIGFYQTYVQAAFVAQVWQGAGNSANNDVITVMVDPEVTDKNADLGLVGLRLEAGVRF